MQGMPSPGRLADRMERNETQNLSRQGGMARILGLLVNCPLSNSVASLPVGTGTDRLVDGASAGHMQPCWWSTVRGCLVRLNAFLDVYQVQSAALAFDKYGMVWAVSGTTTNVQGLPDTNYIACVLVA